MKKIEINVSVWAIIILCSIAYLTIAALAVGSFFLVKDLILPYFASQTVIRLSFLAALIFLVAILSFAVWFIESRVINFAIINFAALIGIVMLILSSLAIFPIYSGWADIIFGWQSFIASFIFLICVLIIFLTAEPKLTRDEPYKPPRVVTIGLNRFSARLGKIAEMMRCLTLAALGVLVVVVIGSTTKGLIFGHDLLIDYCTGLAIYLSVGLMLLRQAGRKLINFFAQLSVGLMGLSVLLFFGPIVFQLGVLPADPSGVWWIMVELHPAFLWTAIILLVFMEILLYNVLRNPKISANPWIEKWEFDPYWHIYLLIGLMRFLSTLGYSLEKAKRYRSFFKVAAVSIICFLLGRLAILELQLQAKEYQTAIWFLAGLLAYLYLGRKLIKSRRKIAIFSLLASATTAGAFLVVFSIFSLFNIYDEASRFVLSWPALVAAGLIFGLIFFGYDVYYRPLPEKSYREQLRSWLQKGKDFHDEHLLLAIVLTAETLIFLAGVVLLIFQSCLDERFVALSGQMKTIAVLLIFCGSISLFVSFLLLVAFISRESYIASLPPNEKAAYEKRRIEMEQEMISWDMTHYNNNLF